MSSAAPSNCASFALARKSAATGHTTSIASQDRAPRGKTHGVNAPYAKLEALEQGIGRVLAHNPSAFTYHGTQTYVVGDRELALIDPGPDLPEHLDALLGAIGGRKVIAIMCTHTHRDHSPAARPLADSKRKPNGSRQSCGTANGLTSMSLMVTGRPLIRGLPSARSFSGRAPSVPHEA